MLLEPGVHRARKDEVTDCDLKLRGGVRYRPFAFTEQGVPIPETCPEPVEWISSVLRSPRAVRVNIAIMRAFVRLLSDIR